jgi:hypothetical protein
MHLWQAIYLLHWLLPWTEMRVFALGHGLVDKKYKDAVLNWLCQQAIFSIDL